MTATAEIEATAVHAPGADLAAYQPQAVEEYRARFVMTADEAGALDRQLRECMRAVLVADVDYGTIPGMGTKPSLFKPGAEKLIQWFGFGFDNVRDEIERDGDGNRVGVTYKCTIHKQLGDGRKVTVATCEGYAGYDEDKFYVSAERASSKAEATERMWAKKDNRAPVAAKWENAAEYRAPWNSLLKMAQKRALVGAAIDATSAAGLFTQDLEDMKSGAPDGAQFTAAARAAIMALPGGVQDALDQWYRGQRWPDPGQWSAEQWCAALVKAGSLAAGGGRPQGPPPAAAAAPSPGPAPVTEPAWLDGALAEAPNLPTIKACQDLWRESATRARGGEITKDDAKAVQEILRARMEDIRQEAVAAAALPPAGEMAAAA